ncbi:hypothetical protein ACFQV2_18585 [Actinokineospora soli]|uniref:Uncharacterized protein n=1 Tax=Actinokineospora soli TaxID=1048753 RepID=A0ABW2TPB7_9PSEU
MQNNAWRLVHDAVIPYGKAGLDTVVHARAYESGPDDLPVVILSEFGDHRARPLSEAVGEAAAAAQAALYRRGADLRFVHHTPHGQRFHEVLFHQRLRKTVFYHRGAPPARRGRSAHWSTSAKPVTVRGVRRHVFEPPRWEQDTPWTFHGPRWRPLRAEPADDQSIPAAAPRGRWSWCCRRCWGTPRRGLARRPVPAVAHRRARRPQARRRAQRRPHGAPARVAGDRGAVLSCSIRADPFVWTGPLGAAVTPEM